MNLSSSVHHTYWEEVSDDNFVISITQNTKDKILQAHNTV